MSKFLFVTDTKPKFGWRVFVGLRSHKSFKVLVNPKVVYENFHFIALAEILPGLSILKIYITILQKKNKACQHGLMIPVTMSSPFPPLRCPTGTSLSSCWLHPTCCHLILFLPYPPTDHQLQPIAAAAVTAAVATADYVVRSHRNCCKEKRPHLP